MNAFKQQKPKVVVKSVKIGEAMYFLVDPYY